MYPSELKYTKEHEWVRVNGEEARVGITDYAQKQLGDVVYLELPEVVDVNRSLADRPETVNKDPHDAWMIAIKLTGAADQADLLDAAQYTQLTQ